MIAPTGESMPNAINPYIAGNPVTGLAMFFGREDVFQFIQQALIGQHQDNIIVLYGQKRTGKTSVLYQMRSHLDKRYLCIFMDMHGFAFDGLEGFLWELTNHILRSLRRNYQIQLPLPKRTEFMADPRSFFENEVLGQLRTTIGHQHILLMLDEVIYLHEHVQAGKLGHEVFEYMRYLMQHYEWLNFLFALGSSLEEMEQEYTFLFNVALYKKISFLDQQATQDLITEPVKDYYQVTPAAINRIYDITSGHPYYTQLLCHCLFNHWQQQRTAYIDVSDVNIALTQALERGSAVLADSWKDLEPAEKAVVAVMATAMHRSNAAIDIKKMDRIWRQHNITIRDSERARAIRSLIARDIIVGQEKYAFTVDLQRLWVQKHRRLELVKEELPDQPLAEPIAAPGSPARSLPVNGLIARLLIVMLVVLLMGGSSLLLYANYYLPIQQHISATATARIMQATGTMTGQSDATATAAIATSDTMAALHHPYPPASAKLVMNDPLVDTSHGYNWDDTTSNCQFPGDGYHVSTAVQELYPCIGNATNFSNFVFEAQMTILKGDSGGLLFRADSNNSAYYDFNVNRSGHFVFNVYTGLGVNAVGEAGQIADFHTGIGQPNLLAIIAQGSQITFYANHHYIESVTFSNFSHGQIGFEATDYGDTTEIVFANAKIWQL